MSFVKFVVARATVERALSIPLVADYIATQGLTELVEEFAQLHPNYSFADLLGEFGVEVETLPGMVKDFVVNHFGLGKRPVVPAAHAQAKLNSKLTFE